MSWYNTLTSKENLNWDGSNTLLDKQGLCVMALLKE